MKPNKQHKLIQELNEYNRLMRRVRSKEKTLDEYIKMKNGKSRYKPKVVRTPLEATTFKRESPTIISGVGIGVSSPKKEDKHYTGNNLIGIGTMHKSNMVPIFKGQDAEDIAKMRRN